MYYIIDMNHNIRKCTFGHVRPAKIQISLHIRAGWSESSLDALWVSKGAMFLHADNEDSDQTARMRRQSFFVLFFLLGEYVRRYIFLRWGSYFVNVCYVHIWNSFVA